jgi:hypothetical protein
MTPRARPRLRHSRDSPSIGSCCGIHIRQLPSGSGVMSHLSVRSQSTFDQHSKDRKWPILLKNSKMHLLHFLAKLNRDRQFGL